MPNTPHHIIAIGASAGGIEELNLFFDNTPLDGVCYVIVQHLSQDFKSRMAELLSRHSTLTVIEATEGIRMQRNYVYMIPNDKFMTINADRLRLTDRGNTAKPHLTIDVFLLSLAKEVEKKAIAVILSGMGTDGTTGITAVKKSGGMVIARDPRETEFPSMPASAIATGNVDLVLSPQQMPSAIEQYINQQKENTVENALKCNNDHIAAIVQLIGHQLPLDFSEYKENTIARRIERRMSIGDFSTLEEYLEHLKTSPKEVKALAQDFLISVTAFFRDPDAYLYLQKTVIPEILKKLPPQGELKVWVAGCATGEEAYSIAMLICEQLIGPYKDITAKIFATDIDQPALQVAGKGSYDVSHAKELSKERLERFFTSDGNTITIRPEIRKMVIFANHDLARNPPYCNLQLITCRNLLIYMTPTLQKKVFAMLHFGLKLDGYLFLGSSESPTSIADKLEVSSKKHKIYKNIHLDRHPRFESFTMPEMMETKYATAPVPTVIRELPTSNGLAEAVGEAISESSSQLIICVDQQHNVVKTYGDTTRYLIQKNFTLNLAELLPRPLAIAFNTLSLKAAKTGKSAFAKGFYSGTEKIDLSVSPLFYKKGNGSYFMVTIATSLEQKPIEGQQFDEQLYHDQYILNLEEEVRDTREQLHSALERLDATNENMQSFNEELLSANEEMQSTNEEMQSVNEELHTINSDYQAKNRELLELNDDLNNYFRSNINGQLFVNQEMQLVKYSPGAVKLINLREGDIGRPLADITTNIRIHTIIDDISEVLKNGSVIHREIQTNKGNWYQLVTMPYLRDAGQRQTGAILTFNDISELKQTQLELENRNKALGRINLDLDHFIHVASHDLLAPLNNIEQSISMMNTISMDDAKLSDYVNLIGRSVKKFGELIRDISAIAKIENQIDTEHVDVSELLENILWSLEGKISSTQAHISTDLELQSICFSKKNLRSILYNLISNAIKFQGEQPPKIFVQVKKEDGYVVLSVQDNGKGIRKRDFDKIFDLYGRLNQSPDGQGIGLYLTRKIINAAGGNMVVESEIGKGSKFTIYFREHTTKSSET